MKSIIRLLLASSLALPLAAHAAKSFEKLPEVIADRMPRVSDSAEGAVAITVKINEQGYVTHAELKDSSNQELAEACLKAVKSWRYSPAIQNGKPVAATFVQPFRFGSNTFVTEEYSQKPEATHRVAPEVPTSLQHITGEVVLLVRLDETGKVSSTSVKRSTHEELNSLASSAVLDWSFSPAVKNGQATASNVYIPFRFKGNPLERAPEATVADHQDLRVVRQTMPELPEELASVGGQVKVEFVVDSYGFVSSPKVISSDDPRLAEVAQQAVLAWKFKPVVRNGQPQAARVQQAFNFGERAVVAQAVDKMPKATLAVSPELPKSLKGVQGRVAVLFSLSESGEVKTVEVKESTQPEIATPILEAARKWTFSPAIKDGKAVSSKVLVPFIVGAD